MNCSSNLKQLGLANAMYLNDNNDIYMPGTGYVDGNDPLTHWYRRLDVYTGIKQNLYRCYSANNYISISWLKFSDNITKYPLVYGYNAYMNASEQINSPRNVSRLKNASRLPMFFDLNYGFANSYAAFTELGYSDLQYTKTTLISKLGLWHKPRKANLIAADCHVFVLTQNDVRVIGITAASAIKYTTVGNY